MPDLPSDPALYILVGGVAIILLIATRIPLVRQIFNVALTLGLIAVMFVVLAQRERLDPYVGRAAEVLNLDSQHVVGRELRIRMSPDGHFWAKATIDGVPRRMLIDSGATLTALSVGTAREAGLKTRDPLVPVLLRTANGTVRPQTADVADLNLGNIVARDLAVVVSPAFGDSDILGMNFLSRLKSWRVEGRTLILTPNYPTNVTPTPSSTPR